MSKPKGSSFRNDLLWGLFFAVACYFLQHVPNLIADAIQKPINFTSVVSGDSINLIADVSGLAPGNYFISLGGPRAPCEIKLDDITIDSNRSEINGLRNGVFLGGGLRIPPGFSKKKLQVNCDSQKGFLGFTHSPIVASYNGGVLIHLLRMITELVMGPLSSLLIIFSFLFFTRRFGLDSRLDSSPFADKRYLFFGTVALFYSLSLALVPRFFLTGMPATVLHVFLRNLFSLAGLMFFTSFTARNRLLELSQILLLLVVPLWGYLAPNSFVLFYRYQYTFFPVASLLITYGLFTKEPRSPSAVVLRRILLAWTLVQSIDCIVNWTDVGIYNAPAVVLLLSVSAFILRRLEMQKASNIESAVAKILLVIESENSIETVLKEVALLSMNEAKFGRVSSYVDGFCVGATPSPGKSFVRVNEYGYRKDTAIDAVISFAEGRGKVMNEAIVSEAPILRFGQSDGAWFLVIPVGVHACINLSDSSPKSDFLAYESLEIIERILPSLLSLERRLIDLGFLQGAALQKLRSTRGDGSWEEEIGSIFVDINDYSRLADEFSDPFTTFVSKVYIPAFIKSVSQFAVSEHVAGDEVYFIVTKDLVSDGVTVREASVAALNAIDNFVYNDGALLCTAAGFSPITTSIGLNVGIGSIVCDTVSVRTAGKLVNHAKRLQEEAGRAGILVGAASELDFSKTAYELGEQVLIQKKKQVVLGNRIIRKGLLRKVP